MIQQALDFTIPRDPSIPTRAYGGWTPSQWSQTSLEAAQSMEPFAPKMREKVLMCITRDSAANHEIEARTRIKLQSVCARVAELREDGLIQDSGRRCMTDSDRPATIWEVTTLGWKIGTALIRAGKELN